MKNKIQVVCLLLALYSSSYSSGWSDYGVALPNGYTLVKTNANSIYISPPDTFRVGFKIFEGRGFAVPCKITRLNIHDKIIFGIVTDDPESDLPGPTGYFILNTETHQASLGMKREEWLKALKKHGIDKYNRLITPSRKFPSVQIPYIWYAVLILVIVSILLVLKTKKVSMKQPAP